MRIFVFCLIAFGLISPAFAGGYPTSDRPGPRAETGLRAGMEKGLAVDSVEVNGVMIFCNEKPRDVLTIGGPVLAKWREKKLGACLLSEPLWKVVDHNGKPGSIYRFNKGIIVKHSGGAFFMSWPIAQTWWPRSGLTRKIK